jgi:F0F1-type ATP synthase delta subunit
MQKNYITAVTNLIATGKPVEMVLENLQSVMKRKGHFALYSKVLRGVSNKLAVIEKNIAPTITVAKPDDANTDQVQAALTKLEGGLASLKVPSQRIVVDPTIIGGAIVVYKHLQIDMSYKSKLKKLYQSVIS